ncbi:MetS family NSS transporter small subunit [Gracilibacillus saliphilus]|nr:MetS family NSS transporter small subunit [Gracilibacillus saliphilus]
MSGSAITMAVIGMVIIWGGLIASVIKAIIASKN